MAITSKLKIIDNYIYFYHLEKFCIIPSYPDSISDSMSSSFAMTHALSRSAPVFSYSYSGPRQVTIQLNFHRDMMNDINRDLSNIKHDEIDKNKLIAFDDDDYVDTLVKHLQAISLPKYQAYNSGSKTVIPPMVAVRFGNTLFIKGVVNTSVQCTYSKPILYNNKYAVVSVNFTIYETDPYDADTVALLGSFRGVTHAFKDGVYSTSTEGNNDPVAIIRNTATTKKKNVHICKRGHEHGGGGSHKFVINKKDTWAVVGHSENTNIYTSSQNRKAITDYYRKKYEQGLIK